MNLETIVNNMISANEPESNIAMVIKTFKQVKDSKNKKNSSKINCEKCDHSWKVADGGNDLYTCHECGHNNSKSPLKQIENTECPEGQEKDQFGNCVPILKPNQSIIQKGSRPVSAAEKVAMTEFEKQKLGDEKESTIELDEVVVTAKAPKPTEDIKVMPTIQEKEIYTKYGIGNFMPDGKFFASGAGPVWEQRVIQATEEIKKINDEKLRQDIISNPSKGFFWSRGLGDLFKKGGLNLASKEGDFIPKVGKGMLTIAQGIDGMEFIKAKRVIEGLNEKIQNKNLKDTDIIEFGGYDFTQMPEQGMTLEGRVRRFLDPPTKMTVAEAKELANKNFIEPLIASEKYQSLLNQLGNVKLLDGEGNFTDEAQQVMGEQLPQMAAAMSTFGLSTTFQAAVDSSKQIINKAVKEYNNLSDEELANLPLEKKAELALEVLDKVDPKTGLPLVNFDPALENGAKAGGLDLIGNFFVVGGATKLMPKRFVSDLLKGKLRTEAIKRSTIRGLGNLGIEEVTELSQDGLTAAAVLKGTGADLNANVIDGISQMSGEEIGELLAQTLVGVGGVTTIGKTTTTTGSLVKDALLNIQANLDPNKTRAILNKAKAGMELKQIKGEISLNEYNDFLDQLDVAEEFINNTKLRDLSADKKEIAFDNILKAKKAEKAIADIETDLSTMSEGDTTLDLDIELDSQKTIKAKAEEEIIKQRALDIMDKDGNAIADYVNNQTEGDFADKKINIFETVKEAETYIKENFNNQLNNAEVKTLLKGGKGSNNGIKVGNEGIIVKENIEANLDEGDLTGANTINHEALHLILDNAAFTDLNNLKKDIITEVGKSKDSKMTKALEFAQNRVKQYSKDGVKGKPLVEEFFTGLSDGLRAIEIKDISLEDGKILKSIGNKFISLFGKNAPGLDFNNLTAVNTLQFIKKFNNFNSKTGPLSTIKGKASVNIDEVRAQKPLTSEEINEQVKDIEKGKMTDDFAVQVAYAYEPLAQTIAKGIYRNYPEFKEQGYTQNDFVDDITFGDPKEIGGTNSLMEIAKQYDPNNPEGKSLGGWLKDIGTQRAKRIADVRIGKQRTTAAQTVETKESQQVADKPAPEITLDKPTTKALALPKELQEAGAEAATLAAAKAKSDISKSPNATQKQKITMRDKAFTQVMNRAAGNEIKGLIRNLGVDAANDYISKNYKAVAEAFVKDKNINKIRDAKTKELLQGWKDGKITKESVTGYFNDPNVKSNTRSDRRNRALTDVISSEIMKQSIKDLKVSDPKIADEFQEETGIVLASKPFIIDNKTKAKTYIADIKRLIKMDAFPPGLLNASMLVGKFPDPKLRELVRKELAKVNFGKAPKDVNYSKTKANQVFGGNFNTIKKKATSEAVAKFNEARGKMFDDFWNSINNIAKSNPKLKGTIRNMVAASAYERSHPHATGAEVVSYDSKGKGKAVWEHAVPSMYAAEELLNAAFDSKADFQNVLTNIKKNYKQVAFPELDAKKIDEGLGESSKFTMPSVNNKPWNLYNDSWTARYDQVAGLNLKNQKWLIPGVNVFTETLSDGFNQMIERTKGVKAEAIYSNTRAQKLGDSKGFQAFVPYSAEDLLGLIYPTLSKGEQGNKDLQWWKDNLMTPYNDGMAAFETAKQAAMLEWKQIQNKIENTPADLNKEAVRGFSNQDAVRVYLWNEQNILPDSKDLAGKDVSALVNHVNNNPTLKTFADQLQKLNPLGYPAPTQNWVSGTITTDLVNFVNNETRNQYLEPYFEAVDAIFTPDNINKLKAQYGNRYVEALKDTLYRMKTGRNRPSGANRQTNNWLNWLNDSVGTIMFFNMRSALLQTISSVNFINWSDNNPAKAAKAFANQKQYWNDFATLFNSDFLKQRRSGLKTDVNADEIAAAAAASTNKVRAGISFLLKKGFLPTQFADSFAIASGGSTFYRNRIKALQKKGLSKTEAEQQAYNDFRTLANESQQSSDPSRISMEQASPLGRVILAFANTPIQYTRLTKRAMQDLANGRGDWKTNVSKIVYYGVAQNIIFTALQQAMFGILFTSDDDLEELGPKEKKFRDDQKSKTRFNIVNSTADMFLRGSGVMGAFIAMFKNMALEAKRQFDKPSRSDYTAVADKMFSLSPPLQSKFQKVQSAGRTFTYKQELDKVKTRGFALNNPALDAALKVISAFSNIPADRVLRKLNHIVESTDSRNEIWQRVALMMGWGEWELGIQARKQDESKALSDSFKALDKSISRAVKKRKKEEEKENKKKSPIKDLEKGVLGKANRDGSIEVAEGLSPAKRKEVIEHEKRHQKEMKSGKLDYDDNYVYYGKKKFERKNGQIAHGGKWKTEGDHSLPWEKFAHNYKRKNA